MGGRLCKLLVFCFFQAGLYSKFEVELVEGSGGWFSRGLLSLFELESVVEGELQLLVFKSTGVSC